MAAQSITVNLPENLYKRIRQTAEDTNRPLETVLLESLALLFGEATINGKSLDSVLLSLSDEQLLGVVEQRLPWLDSMRLRELMDIDRRLGLTATEQAELNALLEEVDRQMIVRSQALALLQKRGHNIRQYLIAGD